jgi:hypothetical protein
MQIIAFEHLTQEMATPSAPSLLSGALVLRPSQHTQPSAREALQLEFPQPVLA